MVPAPTTSSRARVLVPAVGVVVLLVAGLAWWFAQRREDDGARGPETSYEATVAGLCRAASLSAAGDRSAASNTFYDQSHLTLHLLAARVEAQDRRVAADLLVQKDRVEYELDTGAATLPADLRALADHARTAIGIIGAPVPEGCTR